MEQQRSLQLSMSSDLSPTIRRRISYAFCAFCAIYGYDVVFVDAAQGVAEYPRICYGTPPAGSQDVTIPALYVARSPTTMLHFPTQVRLSPTPAYVKLGLDLVPCFHVHPNGIAVDWLGEIFEWLSCADEYAVMQRDDVGRIPFAAAVHGRFGLDPTIPYAGVAMYELNRAIRSVAGDNWPLRPVKPWSDPEETILAPSHDLDYLPISPLSNLNRLLKNIAIAALYFRDPALVVSIAASALRGLVSRRSPLDCVDEMLAQELTAGICSTANIIVRNAHPRDANYELEDPHVIRALRHIADEGMEIGLHGSYTSLENGLKSELDRLSSIGYQAVGIRQHWLRFAGDKLFEEVARVGLVYDSTVGFSEHVGFRAGACFPYPPYDFRRESAYPFVEIPLAIMDVALHKHVRRTGLDPRALCQRVLDMTDAFGWGGVALLWHNTVFRGAQIPLEIGKLYWGLKRRSHKWASTQDVARVAARRLSAAFSSVHSEA